MINALLSLTQFCELPLAIFISQRGIYKEKIAAQFPMGRRLPGIMRGAGIPHSIISARDDFSILGKKLGDVYRKNRIHAFLLSPAIWENSGLSRRGGVTPPVRIFPTCFGSTAAADKSKALKPKFTRFEILNIIAPYLESKVVVGNLGWPSKELFALKPQPSNFYMLGSMGMASPIGLGISLASNKEVVVIDGDGSLLMNPGVLATAAHFAPDNLTIFAVDNSAYGSTGNQPTLTGSCVDLELVARGFGIRKTSKAAAKKQFIGLMKNPGRGLRFIHALAVPGNKDVPNISLGHIEIKKQVQDFLRA
jgi:sulfopyruvate decarboxylase subunit beta